MRGDDLDVLVCSLAVRPFVFHSKIGEPHAVVDNGQPVLLCPSAHFFRAPAWFAARVTTAPIRFVKKLLVVAFEFSIENHSLDAPAVFIQPLRGVQVSVKDPTVMSEFTTIRWAGVEGLPRRCGDVLSAAFEKLTAAFGQGQEPASISTDHIRARREQTRATEALDVLGEGPLGLIGLSKVPVWDCAESSHNSQLSSLRCSQPELAYGFTTRAPRQIQIPREDVENVRVLVLTLSGISLSLTRLERLRIPVSRHPCTSVFRANVQVANRRVRCAELAIEMQQLAARIAQEQQARHVVIEGTQVEEDNQADDRHQPSVTLK
jgi:hypothetical protein